MKVTSFSIISILLILGMALLAKYQIGDATYEYVVPYFKDKVNLPIWVWFIVPAFAYFVLSIIYVISIKIGHYLVSSNIKKEKEIIYEIIKSKIMGLSPEKTAALFGNFKHITDLLNTLDIDINQKTPILGDEREIDKFLSDSKKIKAGEFVDKKEFLKDYSSRLVIQNIKNHISSDSKFAQSIIDDKKFSLDLRHFAFITAVSKGDIKLKEMSKIVEKIQPLGKENYFYLVKSVPKDVDSIDDTIDIFRKAYQKDKDATFAFIYLLLDLEMNKEAESVLEHTSKEDPDMKKIHMYMEGKKLGLDYKLSDYM